MLPPASQSDAIVGGEKFGAYISKCFEMYFLSFNINLKVGLYIYILIHKCVISYNLNKRRAVPSPYKCFNKS